jgi:hypothetical protein
MRDGNVTVVGPRGPNELDVKVTYAGKTMPGVFQVRNDDGARKEIAAYLLDRQLGLGVVPATAMREVQGQKGVLQARPLKYVTQTEVAQKQIRGGGWCDMEPQFQSLYALDVLIGNEGRTPDGVLFDSDDWFVYASGNDKSFGNSKAFPPYLKAKPPAPGAELRRRAATLTEENLAATLGEYVDAKGRKAILERRDALVALPAAASGSR